MNRTMRHGLIVSLAVLLALPAVASASRGEAADILGPPDPVTGERPLVAAAEPR